jgi:uncharacterized lipoprotein YajG
LGYFFEKPVYIPENKQTISIQHTMKKLFFAAFALVAMTACAGAQEEAATTVDSAAMAPAVEAVVDSAVAVVDSAATAVVDSAATPVK